MPPKSPKSSKSPPKTPKGKTSGKSSPSSRTRRKSGRSLKALFAALFLLAFLIVSLVLLSQMRKELPEKAKVAPHAVAEKEEPPFDSRSAVEPQPREVESPPPVAVTEPEPQAEARPLPVPERKEKPQIPLPPPRPDGAPVRVAIIMDDLGRDMATGRALVGLGIPITFAILPDQPQSTRLAEYAHQNGREVIIHIPMEPRGYPAVDPGKDALFVHLSHEEVKERVQSFIARVPHAVGGNNHMGSRFTESREGMQAALSVMQAAGLFFVDSYTSANSVAFDEARRAGIPFAVRDVFLDNVQDVGAITVQIGKLVRLAQERGQAVGICHPHPTTLSALRQAAPELARIGVEVVPVSALLQR